MKKYLLLILALLSMHYLSGAKGRCTQGDVCIISQTCVGYVNENLITDDIDEQKKLVKKGLARRFETGEKVKVLIDSFMQYRYLVKPIRSRTKYWIDSRCIIPNY